MNYIGINNKSHIKVPSQEMGHLIYLLGLNMVVYITPKKMRKFWKDKSLFKDVFLAELMSNISD